jgi:4-amino-4-deoxy-L-arabinose transferase-like glycosyltransferase
MVEAIRAALGERRASGSPPAQGWPWLASGLLLLGAFAVRLVYLSQARANPLYPSIYAVADSIYYHTRAQQVAAGEWVDLAAYFLGPLYHHVMAALYALFGANLESVRLFQCLLGGLSCVLLYWIGRRFFSDGVGLLAGALLALYGLHIYYSELLLPTVLVLFLNLAFLLVMAPGSGTFSPGRCLAGGCLAGLAALAKSNALLLVPAAAAVIWWTQPERSRKRRAACCAALVAGSALAIAPAVLHNYAASGEFVLINTTGGRNLWKGNGPYANGTHVFLPEDRGTPLRHYITGEVVPRRAIEESAEFTRRTLQHMGESPGRAAALFLKKLLLFFNAVELGVRDQFYFAKQFSSLLRLPLPSFGLIAPLGLVGMALAWRRRRETAMLHALFAAQVVSFTAVFVLARYRIVALAVLLLFASSQVFEMARMARESRWRPLGASLAAVLLCAAFVNVSLREFPEERGFALQHKRLGNLFLARGDYQDAIGAYRRSLGADWLDKRRVEEELDVKLRIAQAQLALGRREEARASVEELRSELAKAEGLASPVAEMLDEFERELEAGAIDSDPGRWRR